MVHHLWHITCFIFGSVEWSLYSPVKSSTVVFELSQGMYKMQKSKTAKAIKCDFNPKQNTNPNTKASHHTS